ncbi:MAG: response regulator [Nitrosopumilus sp.]|nr:response regulator [Nitrosopumilus sp.]MDH3486708.1 response regulator [Nitrosopumilus sp.]
MSNTQIMRILIIDDNPALVSVFAKILRVKGFFVTTETTFKEGVEHLKNESYNAVFVDAPLDDFDGKQILTLLQENHVFEKTNVFLFSSVDFNNIELDEWKKEGLYSHLKKPVKRSTVIKALEDLPTKINFTSAMIPSEPIVKYENPIVNN